LQPCEPGFQLWEKSRHSTTPLFRFIENGRVGFIDRSGAVIIPPRFPSNRVWIDDDFLESVARVGNSPDRHPILIDTRGNPLPLLIPPSLIESGLHEGLMIVRRAGRQYLYGFVDRHSKFVIPPTFQSADIFSEGLAPAKSAGFWGYIDKSGKWAITPRYLVAAPFVNGAARVIETGPCRIISRSPCYGDFAISGFGRPPEDLSRLPTCEYSYIDQQGRRISPHTFVEAMDFSEGLAAVGNGTVWGFIDKSGRLRIRMQFDSVLPFSQGLAAVQRRAGARFDTPLAWGYIDQEGEFVLPPRYEWAGSFSEGAAAVGA